jgi:plasmid stability protein
MSKMVQIRNVPDALHRKLKARAAIEGVSLSDLLLTEIRRLAERPSVEEIRQRIAQRSPVRLSLSAAEAIRQERDSR